MTDIASDQAAVAERIVSEALPLSISDLLKNTNAAEDLDHAYIMSYIINMYSDAMKRLQRRSNWGPDDAKRVARILNMVMELNSEPQPITGAPTRARPER